MQPSKQCHKEAKVPHGYGAYGDNWTSPDDTPFGLKCNRITDYEYAESKFIDGY